MGYPGSGKTTTARLVGQALNRQVLDIDDHHLEPMWGTSVANKLKQIGDARFIEEEGKALLALSARSCVIALSGSNPLHTDSMAKLARSGLIVYLDPSEDTILDRLHTMKVDRIVGMNEGKTIEEILKYRKDFYEKWYDLRVFVDTGESPESVAKKVLDRIQTFKDDAGYISTRSPNHEKGLTFLETVLQGLATDGGLFVRANDLPTFTPNDIERLVPLSYSERALRVLERLISPLDISPQELHTFVNSSYCRGLFDVPDLMPVRHLHDNMYVQELFHGPTASFKDSPLQLMPRFFAKAMQQVCPDSKYLILVATSGDTGTAVLDGFTRHAGSANVGVMVLYPKYGVSKVQEHQMKTADGQNVKVVGIEADFDFCQQTVKQIFKDESISSELGDCKLSAANSINWGRLLPQIVHHASAYLDLVKHGHIDKGQFIDVCVPTGNFGNILALYYCKEMGFPIRKLICASNVNNVLEEFINTGVYRLHDRTLKKTWSPSIDILKASNLERLLYLLYEGDDKEVNNFYNNLQLRGEARVSDSVS